MPRNSLVMSDTSPLLNLSLIDSLGLLEDQFDEVVVPEPVWSELLEGDKGVEGLKDLQDKGFLNVKDFDEDALFRSLRKDLDLGESAAISFAVKENADLLLIDEKEGRSAARNHDLQVTGVIGIILRAAREGEIEIREKLDELREEGFWISEELYQKVLDKAS